MNANSILRDGRELNKSDIEIARELEELGLCTIRSYRYVDCVNTEDADYDRLREHDCPAQISIDTVENEIVCPECHRTIYIDEKDVQSGYRVRVSPDGLRKYVRNLCSGITDDSAKKRSSPLRYLDRKFSHVNVAKLSGKKVQIVIATKMIEQDILATARVVDDNLLWVLADEALAVQNTISEFGLHSITIGELIDSDEPAVQLQEELELTVQETREQYLDIAARKAIELCSDHSTLERLDWEEFEHCVQTLLEASLGTSYLFGAVERGSGEPDGALTLHWEKESLFMWDAKFVNLKRNDETELRGEYDKIFRHLKRMDDRTNLQREFGGVAGILLFTPGIKEANIRRLAETIHAREMTNPKRWTGSVVYFELDALVELANAVLANRGEVRHKPNLFRKALHLNLTSPSKHEDDPEKVHSSNYNSLHMSVQDVEEIFEFISGQGREHTEFNREKYLRAAEYFRDV